MRNYRPILIERMGISLPGIDVFRLRLNEHLPESRPSFHSHRHGQLLVYLRGCGEQTVSGKRFSARAGTVIYVGPGERHRFEREQSRQPLCLVVDVRLADGKGSRVAKTQGELPATDLNHIRARVSELFKMRRLGSGDRNIAVGAVILDILDPVLRSIGWLEGQGSSSLGKGSVTVRAEKVLSGVMAETDTDLGQVAERIGFQRDHLNRVLKVESGLTLGQMRSRLRLKQAQKMLGQGVAVGDVSVSVGMNDQNYFARWFRSQVGMAPSEWRSRNVSAT